VESSSFIRAGQFKSPWRVLAGILLRSRDTQAERARRKSEEIAELRRLNQRQQRILEQANGQLAEQRLQIAQLKIENQRLRQQPPVLPDDPAFPNHEFGPKMISVCVNLAMNMGLRASINGREIVMDWLGIPIRLPVWTTVRTWLMRWGVATWEAPVEQADDWIWMADHSNQIGQEKALAVIGIRASNMPPAGVAIRHEDVRLLMREPAVNGKADDVAAAYERLAETAGHPLAVLSDGACELRDGVQSLQKQREETILLSDFKPASFPTPCRKRSEESPGRRRTLRRIHFADRTHAIGHSTDGTRASDARQPPTQSPLHESVGNAPMGEDGAVASGPSPLGGPAGHDDVAHERRA